MMTSFGTHTLRKPIAGGVHKEVWVKTELTVDLGPNDDVSQYVLIIDGIVDCELI